MSSDDNALLISVSRRLFFAMLVPFILALGFVAIYPTAQYVVPAVVIASGVVGGFVGIQRRLKSLTASDLALIERSWIYTLLPPMVGGVLAFLLYVLFLSGLLRGDLFPLFEKDEIVTNPEKFVIVLQQHAVGYQAYAKLVFWSFVAGYSEHFVTDVISRFEGAAVKGAPESE